MILQETQTAVVQQKLKSATAKNIGSPKRRQNKNHVDQERHQMFADSADNIQKPEIIKQNLEPNPQAFFIVLQAPGITV